MWCTASPRQGRSRSRPRLDRRLRCRGGRRLIYLGDLPVDPRTGRCVLLGLDASLGARSRRPARIRRSNTDESREPGRAQCTCWARSDWLIVAAIVITPEDPFPAPIGALPVVATVLVLASGIGATRQVGATWPLAIRPMTYMGATSYSLYLWHWPIVIMMSAVMETTISYYVPALGLTAVASVVSYHLVEQPYLNPVTPPEVRAGRRGAGERLTSRRGGVPAGPVDSPSPQELKKRARADQSARARSGCRDGEDWLQAAFAESLEVRTFPALFPPLDDPYSDMAPEMREESGCLDPRTFDANACTYGPESATKPAVVLGDSIAMSWMPGIRAALPTWRVHAVGLGNCPFAALEIKLEIAEQDRRCHDDYDAIIDHVIEMQPDIVIGSSLEYGIDYLESGAKDTAAVAEWQDGVAQWARMLKPSGADLVILSPPRAPPTRANASPVLPSRVTAPRPVSIRCGQTRVKPKATSPPPDTSTPGRGSASRRCPVFAAGTTMRWDSVRLTASYSSFLRRSAGSLLR